MVAATVFLGVIAVSTLVIALVQVGMVIYGVRLARRINRLVDVVERDIQPMVDRVNSISTDTARATSLAVAQVERVDQMFAHLTERLDGLMDLAQDALVEPVRQGVSLLQALRAGLAALRGVSETGPRPGTEPVAEDDEALFVG